MSAQSKKKEHSEKHCRYKADLVAQGFGRICGVDYVDTYAVYAPVAKFA
jgi:hypothetical protein